MQKLLVANRGEIAIRILRSANELGWDTVAIYTEHDVAHTSFAKEAIKLERVEDFINAEAITTIATSTKCTHVHPGYGFLSESPALPLELAKKGITAFIGPPTEALRISSDKMLSRNLATLLGVPVAPGVNVDSTSDIHTFAQAVGFPVILKALDGGGGRGIRVVDSVYGVNEAYKRSLGESPSKKIFVEKALAGSAWKHIEVQIIGDGVSVNHLWERECSVQRRFQKIIEMAPSKLSRQAVQPLIEASLKIARQLRYKGLGTFEYLFNATSREWVFLEINPRVQVEHTITEEICDIDLVRAQLLLFTPGITLASLDLVSPPQPPRAFAFQLRLTAEDPARSFQLSPGSITPEDVIWPAGRGIRIDSWLEEGPYTNEPMSKWVVGTDFDSLLAKIIVRGRSFDEATAKARRALCETHIGNDVVKTNMAVLAGVIDHRDWASNSIDTLWLERNITEILKLGKIATHRGRPKYPSRQLSMPDTSVSTETGGGVFLQPGTLFNLVISPAGTPTDGPPTAQTTAAKHSLTLKKVKQNAFPNMLSGIIETSLASCPLEFFLSQSTSAAVAGAFEMADLNDDSNIPAPMSGKVVELHPALSKPGEQVSVRKGDVLIVLSVMKMENVVLAPFDGSIERLGKGVSVGVVIGEGILICVLRERVTLSHL